MPQHAQGVIVRGKDAPDERVAVTVPDPGPLHLVVLR
jgi:hypothetical protein